MTKWRCDVCVRPGYQGVLSDSKVLVESDMNMCYNVVRGAVSRREASAEGTPT
jgi:hypothetical protein